jgi:hypothetical protein
MSLLVHRRPFLRLSFSPVSPAAPLHSCALVEIHNLVMVRDTETALNCRDIAIVLLTKARFCIALILAAAAFRRTRVLRFLTGRIYSPIVLSSATLCTLSGFRRRLRRNISGSPGKSRRLSSTIQQSMRALSSGRRSPHMELLSTRRTHGNVCLLWKTS